VSLFTAGTLVDVVVVLAMMAYGVSGFRRGLLVSVLSLGGFLGGAFAAMLVVPELADTVEPGIQRALLVGVAVLACAVIGQLIGSVVGAAVRERVTHEPSRVLDQVLGSVAGVVSVAVVLWFVAGALRASPSQQLSQAVGSSRVFAAVDAAMPGAGREFAADLRAAVAGSDLPRVFSGVAEQIAPVEAPGVVILSSRQLTAAARSIVKVVGDASDCGRGQEGSGAVVAPERVVTNAHVVAGVEQPLVQAGGVGRRYRASVVAFDPGRDVAVLRVPGLEAPALPQGTDLERGQDAVVAGFPRNGPFTATPARVRQVLDARGENIYGGAGVVRQVYSLRAAVEPGNSGGPLLDGAGAMVGVVFARSADDPETGYALTLKEMAPVLTAGLSANAAVDNSGCAVG
jgi:S1-C subfamily serine protease